MSDAPARGVLKSGLFEVHSAQSKRRSSLDEIYKRHWTALCLYLERTFGSGPPEPEDIAQEVFARFAALSDAKEVINPRAFLYRSARNLVFDHYRKHKIRAQFAERSADLETEIVSDMHGENVLIARQYLATVEVVVRNMEPKRRTVFLLKHIEDLSASEIASRTNIPEASVRRYLAQAYVLCLEALRKADAERFPKGKSK
jgi:RNA polymerase sigma-70 factor (ECF subfamily)